MKIRIESANGETTEQVRRLLRYPSAVVQPYVSEARVRVDELPDIRDKNLVRCRVQLRQRDGELTTADELQPTLELAVTRAFERGVRTVKRKQRQRKQVA